jgi:hypothetical protein
LSQNDDDPGQNKETDGLQLHENKNPFLSLPSSRKKTSKRKQDEKLAKKKKKHLSRYFRISERCKPNNNCKKGPKIEEKKSELDNDDHRVQTDKIDPAKVNSTATAPIISKETKRILQIVSARIRVKKKKTKKLRTSYMIDSRWLDSTYLTFFSTRAKSNSAFVGKRIFTLYE